jgi:hypothetical protein
MRKNWYKHAQAGEGQESSSMQAGYTSTSTSVGQGIPIGQWQGAMQSLVPQMAEELSPTITNLYNSLLNECTRIIVLKYPPIKEDIAKQLATLIIKSWTPTGKMQANLNLSGDQIQTILQSIA